jgi:predicted esterase
MKCQIGFFLSILIFSLLVSCAGPTPALTVSPTEKNPLIQPGDMIGEMKLVIAKDETGEPSIHNTCAPIITDSDPAVIVRTCNVPHIPYLFIGYGELAETLEDLNTIWEEEGWKMYLDGRAINLSAFGHFDSEWSGNKLRQWKVAVENVTLGEHQLRFIHTRLHKSMEPTDVTWIFTVQAGAPAFSKSGSSQNKTTYPTLSSAVQSGQTPHTSEKAKLDFLFYIPADYGKEPQQKWPLILYLHGAGDQGDNLDYLLTGGLPQMLEKRSDFPSIVVSPKAQGEYEFWSKEPMIDSLFALLEEVQAIYSIDPKRIYVTGASVGGNGTWTIGLRDPQRFAALVPVMGYYGYPFSVPENICDLKDVPVWAFHGSKDELVPLSAEEGLINALKKCGGNAQLTVFQDAGHDVSYQAYSSPDLFKWMFSQSRR